MKAKGKGLPLILMLVFALSRWPGVMPENFSAAYALAFCAGVFFPGHMAWWLPLAALLGTDCLITLYYASNGSATMQLTQALLLILPNYLAYAALIFLGRRFSAKSSWLRLLSGGLLGALLFYVVTNTISWLVNPRYDKSVAGWLQALTVGLPEYPPTWEFFRNTLFSGGLFTGLFAGAMKVATAMEPEEEEKEAPEAEDAEPEESPA
jgi:hypothetical protein